MEQSSEEHFKSLRVDVVTLELNMHEIGMVLWDEMRQKSCFFVADHEVIKYQSLLSSLLPNNFLNRLLLVIVHLQISTIC